MPRFSQDIKVVVVALDLDFDNTSIYDKNKTEIDSKLTTRNKQFEIDDSKLTN